MKPKKPSMHLYQSNLNLLLNQPELFNCPKTLPSEYEWCEPEIGDIYQLLKYHYICNDDVRMCYSLEFLEWALNSPGQPKD